eukprot:5518035-Prymnesium_polylepis.1
MARCPIGTGRHVSPDPSVRHMQDTSKTHANRQAARCGCVAARSPRCSARGEHGAPGRRDFARP